MRIVSEPAAAGQHAPTQIVLLPAAYSGPEDFLRAGFVRAVRERALCIDLTFADLNLQHLTDRSILRRIRHELVLPARARGCERLWICGISLGGFIALDYAARYTGELDGLCLLAPYLGNHIVIGEIERAGGVCDWQPGELAEDDDERRIWRFIKTRSAGITLYLGFGAADRFAASHRLMASSLPRADVIELPGAHDWDAWTALWERFLDRHLVRAGEQLRDQVAGRG